MDRDGMQQELAVRLPGSMTGRFMYVIPFSMGPVGGPLSKVGIQLTDFVYVVLSMGIMTRVSSDIWNVLADNGQEFVRFVTWCSSILLRSCADHEGHLEPQL